MGGKASLFCAASSIAVLCASSAFAQDGPQSQPAGAGNGQLGEIIVAARTRSENTQGAYDF
jgi:opacity protein-like surface antigen